MTMDDRATKGKKRSWTYGKSSKKALRGVAKAMATSISEEAGTHPHQISQKSLVLPRNTSKHEKLMARHSEELVGSPPVYEPTPIMSSAHIVPESQVKDRLSVKRQSPANAPLPEVKRRKLQRRSSYDERSSTEPVSSNGLSSSSSIASHASLVHSRLSSPTHDSAKSRSHAPPRQLNNKKPNNMTHISRAQGTKHSMVPLRRSIKLRAAQAVSNDEIVKASHAVLDISTNGEEGNTQQPEVNGKYLETKQTTQSVEDVNIASPGSLSISRLRISSKTPRLLFDGLSSQPQTSNKHSAHSKPGRPTRPKLRERLKSVQNHDHSSYDLEISGEEVASHDTVPAKRKNEVHYHTFPSEEADVSAVVQNHSSRFTYAAANRTLLQETDDLLLHHSINAQDGSRSSRRMRELPSPTKRKLVQQEDQEGENPMQSTISSIHELRQAGHRQRLSRRADALMDDIKTNSSAAERRLTLISIIKELQSPAFMQQWLDSVHDNHLLAAIEPGSDPILDLLLIIAIYRIASHGSYSSVLQPQSLEQLSPLLKRCLVHDEEIKEFLHHPKYQVPLGLQEDILAICDSILASPLWHPSTVSEISCRLLSLHLLERAVRLSREAGSTENLLSGELLESLIGILATFDSSSRKARLESSDNCFRLALSILESSAVMYSLLDQDCERLWAKRNIQDLGKLVPKILTDTERDEQLVSLALRLCLNLSNRNLWACKLFSDPDVIQTTLHTVADYFSKLSAKHANIEHNLVLDNLVLCLGFLINLCEKLQSTRELFLEPRGNVVAPIEVILNLFLDKLPDAFEVTSEDETRSNVPFGWLAVLLAYLSKNQSVRWRLKGRLKDGNLRQLVEAVTEFISYHRRVAADVRHPNAGEDVQFNFTERLQSVLDGLREEDGLV